MEEVTPKVLFGPTPTGDTVKLRDIAGREVVAERTWLFALYRKLAV